MLLARGSSAIIFLGLSGARSIHSSILPFQGCLRRRERPSRIHVVQGAGFRVSVKSSANNRERMEVAEPEEVQNLKKPAEILGFLSLLVFSPSMCPPNFPGRTKYYQMQYRRPRGTQPHELPKNLRTSDG